MCMNIYTYDILSEYIYYTIYHYIGAYTLYKGTYMYTILSWITYIVTDNINIINY